MQNGPVRVAIPTGAISTYMPAWTNTVVKIPSTAHNAERKFGL